MNRSRRSVRLGSSRGFLSVQNRKCIVLSEHPLLKSQQWKPQGQVVFCMWGQTLSFPRSIHKASFTHILCSASPSGCQSIWCLEKIKYSVFCFFFSFFLSTRLMLRSEFMSASIHDMIHYSTIRYLQRRKWLVKPVKPTPLNIQGILLHIGLLHIQKCSSAIVARRLAPRVRCKCC